MDLDRLDFLYTPSDDVSADLAFLTDVLGGAADFAIDDGGTKLAMVTLGNGPPILLTNHLEGDRPIHVYAVASLAAEVAALRAAGARIEREVELPPGPAATFRSPSGLRFAIYEPSRPFVVESFKGRRDF